MICLDDLLCHQSSFAAYQGFNNTQLYFQLIFSVRVFVSFSDRIPEERGINHPDDGDDYDDDDDTDLCITRCRACNLQSTVSQNLKATPLKHCRPQSAGQFSQSSASSKSFNRRPDPPKHYSPHRQLHIGINKIN